MTAPDPVDENLAIEGHRISLRPIKRWILATCTCGWASASHPTEIKATAAAIRHLEIRGRHGM